MALFFRGLVLYTVSALISSCFSNLITVNPVYAVFHCIIHNIRSTVMQDVGSQSRDIPVFYLLELTYPSIDNVSFGGVPLDIDTGSRTYFYVSVADGIGIPLLIRLRNVYDWESDVFRGCWQQLCAMSSGSHNYADKGSILDGANVSLNTSMVSIPMPNDLRECINFGDNHVDSSRDMGRS